MVGIPLWVAISYGIIAAAFSQNWNALEPVLWLVLVTRVQSDVLGKYTVCGWTCLFCGKPFMGTLWQAFTCNCKHED